MGARGPAAQPLAQDIGMGIGQPHQLDLVETHVAQEGGHCFGGSLDFAGRKAGGRDAGNSRQLDQLLGGLRKARLEGVENGVRSGHRAARVAKRGPGSGAPRLAA